MRRSLSVLAVGVSLGSVSSAATLTVDLNGGADYTDIQSAIDDAEGGDSVLVLPGEYVIVEPLTLRGKGIALKGQDGFYQAGCPTEGKFTDNLDGTVTDNCTGLTWQEDTADVSGNQTIGEEDRLNWQNALAYCDSLEFADHDDWRLPNMRELQSIVDFGRAVPAIDPVFSALPDGYWSSSTFVILHENAWGVHFYSGAVLCGSGEKYLGFFVRAVRGGL